MILFFAEESYIYFVILFFRRARRGRAQETKSSTLSGLAGELDIEKGDEIDLLSNFKMKWNFDLYFLKVICISFKGSSPLLASGLTTFM